MSKRTLSPSSTVKRFPSSLKSRRVKDKFDDAFTDEFINSLPIEIGDAQDPVIVPDVSNSNSDRRMETQQNCVSQSVSDDNLERKAEERVDLIFHSRARYFTTRDVSELNTILYKDKRILRRLYMRAWSSPDQLPTRVTLRIEETNIESVLQKYDHMRFQSGNILIFIRKNGKNRYNLPPNSKDENNKPQSTRDDEKELAFQKRMNQWKKSNQIVQVLSNEDWTRHSREKLLLYIEVMKQHIDIVVNSYEQVYKQLAFIDDLNSM